jgi:hypothetical protein
MICRRSLALLLISRANGSTLSIAHQRKIVRLRKSPPRKLDGGAQIQQGPITHKQAAIVHPWGQITLAGVDIHPK